MAGLAVAATAAALVPAAAAQAVTTPAAGSFVKIGHSNKCLNIANNSADNSAKVVQYTCSTSATATNDKFKLVPQGDGFYWVQAVSSGKCLNVPNNSTADSALIIQYTCSATGGNNLWFVDEVPDRPTFRLIAKHSGKCLNLPSNNTADNIQLIQYTCSTSPTKTNEQFYQPPTTSATPVARAFTRKQPVAVVQGAAPTSGATAPLSYSWISADNQLTVLTDFDPDPASTNPSPPDPTYVQTANFGYTGRAQLAKLQDGRVQVLGHDAAAGDTALANELTKGTGEFDYLADIGGAFAGQPVLGPLAANGSLATWAVISGQLWYAPQAVNNPQAPYGAWRNLGGTGLTGTPSVVRTQSGARVFALDTTGAVLTAAFENGQLSDWVRFGTSFANLNAVGLSGFRSLVVVRHTDGRVLTKVINADGSFGAAFGELTGLTAVGTPAAVVDPATSRVVIATRDSAGKVYAAAETGAGTGQWGAWTEISDPESTDTLAGGDPTGFSYTVPSGASFGIAWPSAATDVDFPIVAQFPSGAGVGVARKTGLAKPEIEKLKPPKKVTTLKD
ncbi:RICIN domain-containing protein [Actinoplanes sp. N902-109]|uniref:RICIN domain-containing protein n=1 Tax=Actinoplanes sp. (strain N902-109) TaxID=649831 RepID=UPI0003293A00|nr:RICIN domain-containing protein [Actinoplanes sp. N902-109]AGL20487.1 beta-xylosidase [Actinoplanes sp. N902-109]